MTFEEWVEGMLEKENRDDLLLSDKKLVGYVGVSSMKKALKLWNRARASGYDGVIQTDPMRSPKVIWVMVYNAEKLQAALDKNKRMLTRHGGPWDAYRFVLQLWIADAPRGALFDFIADIFGDKTNPGRRDIRKQPWFEKTQEWMMQHSTEMWEKRKEGKEE